MGFYYTPNLNHIHLSVSIILSNGERVCLLLDGTRFDCREFFYSPKSEINEQCYRKLFNEFTLFPEYLREMPDALIKKVEAILFAMYIAKPSLKIKQERLSPTDEKFRSPDKKRAKTIYTPSPKSSPEPIDYHLAGKKV
ncbi:hypothetical protein PVAND_013566 [Polypedilum vanderplanki]|uniref:Uncharacterized protein n=1 Tax=Polypedilum vanderplanki TaxID=319348 RepID=A0A9J6CRZ4_POLVA|nr:hypothetical protein PVAND_013566 [Polypedilum vanderplanki]